MQNNTLSLKRIGLLIWSDLNITFRRDLLIICGLLAVCFWFFLVVTPDSSMPEYAHPPRLPDYLVGTVKFHLSFFPITLFAGGFIFTSLSFRELNKKSSRQFFLSLPAANSEKVVSKWLISGLLFPIAWMLVYQLFAFFTYSWVAGDGFMMVHFSILDPLNWIWVGIYALLQSVFFLGAISFPQFSLIKTVLALFVIGLFIWLVYEVTFPASRGFNFIDGEQVSYWKDQFLEFFWKVLAMVLFPILTYVSFLKLKEKEL